MNQISTKKEINYHEKEMHLEVHFLSCRSNALLCCIFYCSFCEFCSLHWWLFATGCQTLNIFKLLSVMPEGLSLKLFWMDQVLNFNGVRNFTKTLFFICFQLKCCFSGLKDMGILYLRGPEAEKYFFEICLKVLRSWISYFSQPVHNFTGYSYAPDFNCTCTNCFSLVVEYCVIGKTL